MEQVATAPAASAASAVTASLTNDISAFLPPILPAGERVTLPVVRVEKAAADPAAVHLFPSPPPPSPSPTASPLPPPSLSGSISSSASVLPLSDPDSSDRGKMDVASDETISIPHFGDDDSNRWTCSFCGLSYSYFSMKSIVKHRSSCEKNPNHQIDDDPRNLEGTIWACQFCDVQYSKNSLRSIENHRRMCVMDPSLKNGEEPVIDAVNAWECPNCPVKYSNSSYRSIENHKYNCRKEQRKSDQAGEEEANEGAPSSILAEPLETVSAAQEELPDPPRKPLGIFVLFSMQIRYDAEKRRSLLGAHGLKDGWEPLTEGGFKSFNHLVGTSFYSQRRVNEPSRGTYACVCMGCR